MLDMLLYIYKPYSEVASSGDAQVDLQTGLILRGDGSYSLVVPI